MRIPAALFGLMLLSVGCSFLRAGEPPNLETFAEATAYFRTNDYPKGEAAARALARFGDKFKDDLLAGLDDPDFRIRRFSALTLRNWKALDAEMVQLLAQHLKNEKEPMVRTALVDALRFSKNPLALPPLIAAVDDVDSNTRSSAVMGVGSVPGDRNTRITTLLKVLNEGDENTTGCASQGLWHLRLNEKDQEFSESLALITTTGKIADARMNALREYTKLKMPPAVTVVIATAAINDAAPLVRSYAARVLARNAAHSAAALPKLMSLLQDADLVVRADACLALFNLHQDAKPLVDILRENIQAQKGREKFRRDGLERAFEVLRDFKGAGADAAPDLIALGAEFEGVLWTLESMGPAIRSSSPVLITWLNINESKTTNAVLNVLYETGVESACLPQLLPYLQHSSPHAKKMAAYILERAEREQK